MSIEIFYLKKKVKFFMYNTKIMAAYKYMQFLKILGRLNFTDLSMDPATAKQ